MLLLFCVLLASGALGVDHNATSIQLKELERNLETHPVAILIAEDTVKIVKDAMEITNQVLDLAGSFKPLSDIFKPIADLGKLALSIFGLFTRQPDPVMEKLKEIEKQIDRLDQQMFDQFNALRSFITEKSFDEKFLQPAATLHKFMLDTFRFPGNDSIAIFHSEYRRNRPQELAYTLIESLRSVATNPLVQAMNIDRYKTTETFKKWSNITTSVMMQLLYIETYANGMFDNSTLYGSKRIAEQMEQLDAMIAQKERFYKDNYWPTTVQNLMVDLQNKYPNSPNYQRAMTLRDGINSILQDDIYTYFAIVYDFGSGYHYHGFDGYDHLESFRVGGCNMAVMRTRKQWSPNWAIKEIVDDHIVQDRHKKKGDNRCLDMLRDAAVFNPNALANAFIVGGNPAIYTTSDISPGAYSLAHGVTWIATYR